MRSGKSSETQESPPNAVWGFDIREKKR